MALTNVKDYKEKCEKEGVEINKDALNALQTYVETAKSFIGREGLYLKIKVKNEEQAEALMDIMYLKDKDIGVDVTGIHWGLIENNNTIEMLEKVLENLKEGY